MPRLTAVSPRHLWGSIFPMHSHITSATCSELRMKHDISHKSQLEVETYHVSQFSQKSNAQFFRLKSQGLLMHFTWTCRQSKPLILNGAIIQYLSNGSLWFQAPSSQSIFKHLLLEISEECDSIDKRNGTLHVMYRHVSRIIAFQQNHRIWTRN